MKHTLESRMAAWFAMSDETWRRHANPWSVWTRVPVLPLLILAIWSRTWLGWWALVPIGAVIAWTWFNPRIFPKPRSTHNWASKGVFGERVWLNRRNIPVPVHHLTIPNLLSGASAIGLVFLIWGLWQLQLWPTLAGLIIVLGGKLWFFGSYGLAL